LLSKQRKREMITSVPAKIQRGERKKGKSPSVVGRGGVFSIDHFVDKGVDWSLIAEKREKKGTSLSRKPACLFFGTREKGEN